MQIFQNAECFFGMMFTKRQLASSQQTRCTGRVFDFDDSRSQFYFFLNNALAKIKISPVIRAQPLEIKEFRFKFGKHGQMTFPPNCVFK